MQGVLTPRNIATLSDKVYPSYLHQQARKTLVFRVHFLPLEGSIYPIDGGFITVGFPRP